MIASGAAVAPLATGGARSASGDARALALAHALARLQAAFYSRAVAAGTVGRELLAFATTAGAHEAVHVTMLEPNAAPGPGAEYDFGDDVRISDAFAASAVLLEDLTVAAYNGILPGLSRHGVRVAGEIVSVDARHAAWVRAISGRDPSPGASDAALPAAEVMRRVERTGYVRTLTP